MKRLLAIILTLLICITPSISGFGCGNANKPGELGSNWEEILALAREEGVVNIYTMFDRTYTVPILTKAMKEYGITVRNQPLYYREAMTKVEAEAAANVYICDLVTMSLGYMLEASNTTYYDDYGVLPSMNTPIVNEEESTWTTDPKTYPYGYVFSMGSPYGITCNTDNLDAAGIDFPTSWADLASEDYYGKIVMTDPTRVGSGFSIIAAQLYYGPMGVNGTKVFDRDWIKAVLRNMYIAPNMTAIPAELIEGRHTVYIPSRVRTPFNELEEDDSIPLGWRYPDEGAYLSPMLLIPIKESKHPNAAYVLLNYIFSEEGQKAIAAGLTIPNIAGIDTPEQYEDAGSVWGTYADAMYDVTPLQPYPQNIDLVKENEESIGALIDGIKEELEAEGEWNNYHWLP